MIYENIIQETALIPQNQLNKYNLKTIISWTKEVWEGTISLYYMVYCNIIWYDTIKHGTMPRYTTLYYSNTKLGPTVFYDFASVHHHDEF